MTPLYLLLLQLAGSLVINKIKNDSVDAETRKKLMQTVDDLWDKANAAHVQTQTGVNPDDKKS